MRRSRTDSIGLIVSDVSEPAFAGMAHGVEQAAAEHGLTLLLANSAEDADRERRAIQTLFNRRVDGLILACAAATDSAAVWSLHDEQTPVILLDRLYRDLPFDQVGADNRESMRDLIAHMVAQGHRSFLLIAGDDRVPTLAERVEGFRDALRDAGLALGTQHILTGVDDGALFSAVTRVLSEDGVTAVVACSTPLAVLALEALDAVGQVTPDNVAFATFDGFSNPDLFRPRLTTVRQPAIDMGKTAIQLLVSRLASPEVSPRITRLHQTIELRDSTEMFAS